MKSRVREITEYCGHKVLLLENKTVVVINPDDDTRNCIFAEVGDEIDYADRYDVAKRIDWYPADMSWKWWEEER